MSKQPTLPKPYTKLLLKIKLLPKPNQGLIKINQAITNTKKTYQNPIKTKQYTQHQVERKTTKHCGAPLQTPAAPAAPAAPTTPATAMPLAMAQSMAISTAAMIVGMS